MVIDSNFRFLSEKIAELKSAVMYSMSNSLVKLPNDVVTLVKIDEEGHLWFLSHSPAHLLKECEQVFPARLHFFRKGCDFFVEVSGKAQIVNNVSSSGKLYTVRAKNKNAVLVKMSMVNIEYTEPHARREKTKLQLLAEKSYRWMLRNIGFQHTEGSVLSKLHH